jgi:hypothetical protein
MFNLRGSLCVSVCDHIAHHKCGLHFHIILKSEGITSSSFGKETWEWLYVKAEAYLCSLKSVELREREKHVV